jgi:hypothetical protein
MRLGDEKKWTNSVGGFERMRTESNHAQKIRLWGLFWASQLKRKLSDRARFARHTLAHAVREYRLLQWQADLARQRVEEARKYVALVKEEARKQGELE